MLDFQNVRKTTVKANDENGVKCRHEPGDEALKGGGSS